MTPVLPRFNEIRAVIDRPYRCQLRIRRTKPPEDKSLKKGSGR